MSVLLVAVIATVIVVWATVAVGVSVLVGRAISLAERRAEAESAVADERELVEQT